MHSDPIPIFVWNDSNNEYLFLPGEVEKWTLIPSHYKLLSSFVTVTIFQLVSDLDSTLTLGMTDITHVKWWMELMILFQIYQEQCCSEVVAIKIKLVLCYLYRYSFCYKLHTLSDNILGKTHLFLTSRTRK